MRPSRSESSATHEPASGSQRLWFAVNLILAARHRLCDVKIRADAVYSKTR